MRLIEVPRCILNAKRYKRGGLGRRPKGFYGGSRVEERPMTL